MGDALLLQEADPKRFTTEPETMVRLSWTDAFGIPAPEVEKIRLEALRNRFALLVDKVEVLKNLADEQGISEITSIEDGALLLFRHSVYKSYPISFLEKARFDRLTEWLDGLTVHDLSGIDASGIETIDDWLALLDRETELRIIHSSGTTGKLSLLPRSESEIPTMVIGWFKLSEGFRNERNAGLTHNGSQIPVIFPGHRYGAYAGQRVLDGFQKYLYDGDGSLVVALNPGRLSADAASLAGRVRAAENKGELGRLQLGEKLLARQAEFIKEQAEAPGRTRDMLREVHARFGGKRVMCTQTWGGYYDFAVEAQKLGLRQVFAPDSRFCAAGGLKGRTMPDDYQEVVKDFLGVPALRRAYGMSEVTTLVPDCPEGYYHISPWIIPYVLDPETGQPAPRTGTHTGRFGLIDLTVTTHWGGFLTGDEVTLSFGDTEPCSCGREGAYLHPNVQRYSEKQGGDDKITCAGAPEAMDKALTFITQFERS
jgi:hypothetical protein